MNENQMRLRDAGVREWRFARHLVNTGVFQKTLQQNKGTEVVRFEDLLDNSVYDAKQDCLLVAGIAYKVENVKMEGDV